MSRKIIEDCARALHAAGETERAEALLKVAVVEVFDDGGVAFPQSGVWDGDRNQVNPAGAYFDAGGMSLRDWFAGQMLAGEGAAQVDGDRWDREEALADHCYNVANAMILRRARR